MEDHVLIEQFRDPQSRQFAFNQLIHKYQERVYWHIRKMVIDHDDTNDLTQDVFVKIYQNLETFRADAQLFTWIYRIATNECLGFLRKKKNRTMVTWDDAENELQHALANSLAPDGDEIQLKLQQAILTLPEKQRLVFNMKYFDELKYEDISSILDTSVGALKASYHHAVKKIEAFINQDAVLLTSNG